MSKSTSITLGKHLDSFVTAQLKSGRYASTSKVPVGIPNPLLHNRLNSFRP
jgi:hypothetical protein